MRPRRARDLNAGVRRARRVALWALLPLSAAFLLFPPIDLWFSRLFLAPDGRFPPDAGLWHLWRLAVWDASVAVALFGLLMLILTGLRGRRMAISARIWGFVTLSFALGPGLLANGILKTWWGRARPQSVLEFGGTQLFTPPVLIADQCRKNCSFVSGEASGAVTLVLVLGLVLLPGMGARARWWGGVFLGFVALSASFLRVVTGRHFLSDTLFAADLMVIVVLSLFLWLGVAGALARVSPGQIGKDLLAGLGLRR